MNQLEKISNSLVEMGIDKLEKSMLPLPQVDCPVIHRFSPGLYIREVTIPAGTIAIGYYQKKEHLNVFLKGKVTMLGEDGSFKDLEAPMIFNGQPGRKVGYIHETISWLNIYPTDERDVETLEGMFLDKSEVSVDYFNKQFEAAQLAIDNNDYKKMLEEIGVTEESVWEESSRTDDLIDFPYGAYEVKISNSPIHGKGIFATVNISQNTVIAPSLIDGKRTPAGRYTNHSEYPNAKMIYVGDDIWLKAEKDIVGQKGGQVGEEITTNYRETFCMKGGNICLV